MANLKIRKAQQNEATQLTSIAFNSKAYWGYSQVFMESCRDELTLTKEMLLQQPCYVALIESKMAGFYLLQKLSASKVEMEMLFVHPDFIGKGIGKQLFAHAVSISKKMGCYEIEIQADPFAQPFYAKMGAVVIRQTPSQSIPNRFLPQMILQLENI